MAHGRWCNIQQVTGNDTISGTSIICQRRTGRIQPRPGNSCLQRHTLKAEPSPIKREAQAWGSVRPESNGCGAACPQPTRSAIRETLPFGGRTLAPCGHIPDCWSSVLLSAGTCPGWYPHFQGSAMTTLTLSDSCATHCRGETEVGKKTSGVRRQKMLKGKTVKNKTEQKKKSPPPPEKPKQLTGHKVNV